MIDSYVFKPESILSLEYLESTQTEVLTTPLMLRDFSLISTREDLIKDTGIYIQIYLRNTGERITKLYMDADYKGPPCFNCGPRGNWFLDQLANEREDNLCEHYMTKFMIPFDPNVPIVTLDKAEGCYMLKTPTEQQQIEIFCGYVQRVRRL